MKMWKSLLLAGFLCSLVGAQVPLDKAEIQRQLMLRWCRQNLANQFLPGYRATVANYFVGADPDLDMTQGRVVATHIPLNLAIFGEGFFCLEAAHYTREGRFLWQNGRILGPGGLGVLGYRLDEKQNIASELGPIDFPMDPENNLYLGKYNTFSWDSQGTLLGGSTTYNPVTQQDFTEYTPVYRLAIATFAQPHRLLRGEGTLLQASSQTGATRLEVAGENRAGFVIPGSLELSNVDPVEQAYLWGRLDAAEPRKTSRGKRPVKK